MKAYPSLTLFFCLLLATLAFAEDDLHIYSATASSYYRSYTAPKTIDNNFATYWQGARGKSYWWLKLDLGSSKSLSKISIWWHQTYGSTNYHIQASNNNRTWVNLYMSLSSAGGITNPHRKDHTLTGSYRYVRIYIKRAQRYYPIIYEVKLYGMSGHPAPPQITSVTPPDGSRFYENDIITISCTVNGSLPLEYQFSIDGIIKQAWSSVSTYTWQTTSEDIGLHKIKVEVKNVGGSDSKEVEVYVLRKPIPPPE